jgi:hypothetical protein
MPLAGGRQTHFKVFAELSGHENKSDAKTAKSKSSNPALSNKAKRPPQNPKKAFKQPPSDFSSSKDIGLTVRVEINLPPDGTKETYDNIFKSIKENLING